MMHRTPTLPAMLQPETITAPAAQQALAAAYGFAPGQFRVYRGLYPLRTPTDILEVSMDDPSQLLWLVRHGQVVENPPTVSSGVVHAEIAERYRPENAVVGPMPFAAGFMVSVYKGFELAHRAGLSADEVLVFRLDREATRFLPIDSARLEQEAVLGHYAYVRVVLSDDDLRRGRFISTHGSDRPQHPPIDPVAFRDAMAGAAAMAQTNDCLVVFGGDGLVTVRLGDAAPIVMAVDPSHLPTVAWAATPRADLPPESNAPAP